MTNKVLMIDDDENICRLVKLNLEKEGFQVLVAYDGESGLDLVSRENPDLILLDIMMPGMDGVEVLRQIRKDRTTPVIMLTAKADTFDKVLGLELGADDYITKPFDTKELTARIKAVIRRTGQEEEDSEVVRYDNLEISLANYEVKYFGKKLEMPPKELELLYFLASHPGKVFTREQLLRQVWEFDFYGDSRTVDVHIKRLREKLTGNQNWEIKTVWGVGYKFEVNE
ncbi:MAG: response regulator transcription factor [Christensenellaceae bacterium]|nr:response regulator transcription factor [Christensenellaceae bacterium]